MSPGARLGNVRYKFTMNSMNEYGYGSASANPMVDSLHAYYGSNEELLRSDTILQMVLGFLQGKLFSDGLQFVQGKELVVPPDVPSTNAVSTWLRRWTVMT